MIGVFANILEEKKMQKQLTGKTVAGEEDAKLSPSAEVLQKPPLKWTAAKYLHHLGRNVSHLDRI